MSTSSVVTSDTTTSSSHGTTSRQQPDATTGASQFSSDEIERIRRQRQEQTDLFKQVITQTPDFPKPGIVFEDVFPIFTSPKHHEALIRAYELQIQELLGSNTPPDVIVGLDARGFCMGPTLALRLGCSFVPVRKEGKLPGKVETARYEKEYGADVFAIQSNAIKPGAKVLVVDDLIATGGSAAAAAELVSKSGGELVGFIFIIELIGLKGRSKLNAPVYTLIESQN